MSHVFTKTSSDGKYDFCIITKDRLPDAISVIREAFFKDENVSIATEVAQHPEAITELEELCLRAARDGVSVVAIDKATNRTVAASFNKIQVASTGDEGNYFERFEAKCQHPSSKALVRYMIDMEAKFDIFEAKAISCAFEIMFIATLREHRGRHLASELWALSIEIARQLKDGVNIKVPLDDKEELRLEPVPQLVMALATSNLTSKIAEKFGFEVLQEVGYDQFSFAGKTFAERIGPETPSSAFVCYCLN